MLRSEIIAGTERLLLALKDAKVSEVISTLLKREGKIEEKDILECYTAFVRRKEQFSDVEATLMKIFELNFLLDYEFWVFLISTEKGQLRSPVVYEKYNSLKFAMEYVPKIVSLLRRSYDDMPIKAATEYSGEASSGFSKLRVFLHEDEQISTPKRLAITLEAIDDFYHVLKEVEDTNAEELRVISCDSGSDKAFDFLGAAKIIECVKDLIICLWDKVVYYRENQTGRRLELVTQSLPIIDKIDGLCEEGKLEAEKAELLKRQVTEAVGNFLKSGATILEMDMHAVQSPKILMRAERKLLSPYPGTTAEENETTKSQELPAEDPDFQAFMTKMADEYFKHKAQKEA